MSVARGGKKMLMSLLAAAGLFVAIPAHVVAATSTHSPLFTLYANWEKEENPRMSPRERRFPPPEEQGFENACGVAVDPSGTIYVSDYYHSAVDVFARRSHGIEYITQIPSDAPGNGPCGLAVDAAGHVYVNYWRGKVMKYTPSVYPPTEATRYTGTVIDPGRSTGVALDPTTGNVLVDDRSYIAEYEPSGAPVESGGEPLRIGLGTLGSGYGVGASGYGGTDGYVYVADASDRTVKVYDPTTDAANPIVVIEGAGTPQGGFDSLVDSSIAIDPTDGNLFVTDSLGTPIEHPEAVVDEFNPSGAFRGQLPGPLAFGAQSGLYVDQGGNVYVTSGNTENSAVYAFGPTTAGAELRVTAAGSGEGSVQSAPVGIACGTACAAEFNLLQVVTLTATPDAHSRLVGWSGCESEPGPGECRVTMSAARSVTAEFAAIPQQQLTLSASGPGEVTSSPAGLDCREASCGEHFDESGSGSIVTLTATPDAHSRLVGWSGCESEPGPGECRVTMSAARSVTAEFGPLLRVVAIDVGGAGSGFVVSTPAGVSCSEPCSFPFVDGASVTFTPVPAPRSVFTGWTGACTGIDLCRLTMDSDIALTASFAPIPKEGSTTPPVAELSLGKVARGSSPFALKLSALTSAPGSLMAQGKDLKKVTVKLAQSGKSLVGLALDRAGRKALRSTRSARLSVTVKVTFSPLVGEPQIRTKQVIFRLPRSGHKQRGGEQ